MAKTASQRVSWSLQKGKALRKGFDAGNIEGVDLVREQKQKADPDW